MTARDGRADPITRQRTGPKATDQERERMRRDRIGVQRAGHKAAGTFFGWVADVVAHTFGGHAGGRGKFPSATKAGPGRRYNPEHKLAEKAAKRYEAHQRALGQHPDEPRKNPEILQPVVPARVRRAHGRG